MPTSSASDTVSAVVAHPRGSLTAAGDATTATYQVYFHVPIATDNQAPVTLTVAGPDLVDWRFVRLEPPNVLGVATLRQTSGRTRLDWDALVLLRTELFDDRPRDVPLAALDNVPPELWQWLTPTDCVQFEDPMIMARAAAVASGATTVDELAQAIVHDVFYYVYGQALMTHLPRAFDAFYAFAWGGTCISHAHAAAALFRANGVPARNVHVIPVTSPILDMHWMVEYWLPGYGWVGTEPTYGSYPMSTAAEIKTFVVQAHDEFPMFFVNGIDGMWHTSDPALGRFNPNWGGAHSSVREDYFDADDDQLEAALALARETFERTVDLQGTRLEADRRARLDDAAVARNAAVAALQDRDLVAFSRWQRRALSDLVAAMPRPPVTLWRDDLEGDTGGWSHGGEADEWELGTPLVGPDAAHSGSSCWGTDLDDTYQPNADTWLLSPPFSLDGMASATLSVWVHCRVREGSGFSLTDPLWLEMTSDGVSFTPISSQIVGGNDDPAIPDVGGWSRLVLDLTEHIQAEPVRVRFRFTSMLGATQAGCYVDDIEVEGRPQGSGAAPRRAGGRSQP